MPFPVTPHDADVNGTTRHCSPSISPSHLMSPPTHPDSPGYDGARRSSLHKPDLRFQTNRRAPHDTPRGDAIRQDTSPSNNPMHFTMPHDASRQGGYEMPPLSSDTPSSFTWLGSTPCITALPHTAPHDSTLLHTTPQGMTQQGIRFPPRQAAASLSLDFAPHLATRQPTIEHYATGRDAPFSRLACLRRPHLTLPHLTAPHGAAPRRTGGQGGAGHHWWFVFIS
jgi:hypothetical protein